MSRLVIMLKLQSRYSSSLLLETSRLVNLPILPDALVVAAGCYVDDAARNERLEELIEAQRHDVWWENVLYSLSDERPVYVQDVGDRFWAEVDFIEDYERILAHVRETGV